MIALEKCNCPSFSELSSGACFFPCRECSNALLFWCGAQAGIGSLHCCSQIVFGDDVVAIKNRACPMAADCHRDALRDATRIMLRTAVRLKS